MKNNCIFTEPTIVKKTKQKAGFFYAQKSDSDLNTGYQIPLDHSASCKSVTVVGATGGDSLFLFYKINFLLNMPTTEKITPKLNNSKLKSTSVARHATPTLTLTGVKNPYLFCLRKILRDFLEEEKRGGFYPETRLILKIEAARLMFPEARLELTNLLK